MNNAEIKSLLTEALQKIESLMDKCETLPSIRKYGEENLQHEMKDLINWLRAREGSYDSIEEAIGKLEKVSLNAPPGTYFSALYDAHTDIGNSLGWLDK